MAGSVKYLACKALGDRLQELEATLVDRVSVLQQLPDQLAEYPKVAILPERFKYQAWYEGAIEDDAGEVVTVDGDPLMRVASFDGTIRLWVGSNYAAQREQVEDAILRSFHLISGAPGRIDVTIDDIEIGGVATGYDAPISFTLGPDTEWREELVFSERRWSYLMVGLSFPLYVTRSDAALVQSLWVAITGDTETTIPDGTTAEDLGDILPDVEWHGMHGEVVLSESTWDAIPPWLESVGGGGAVSVADGQLVLETDDGTANWLGDETSPDVRMVGKIYNPPNGIGGMAGLRIEAVVPFIEDPSANHDYVVGVYLRDSRTGSSLVMVRGDFPYAISTLSLASSARIDDGSDFMEYVRSGINTGLWDYGSAANSLSLTVGDSYEITAELLHDAQNDSPGTGPRVIWGTSGVAVPGAPQSMPADWVPDECGVFAMDSNNASNPALTEYVNSITITLPQGAI